MRRVRALVLVVSGVLILAVLGWTLWTSTRESYVRGVLTSVEARDIGHAASVTVRTADGKDQRFLVDASVEGKWTPGHLRDHMMFGQGVTVYYRRAGDALVAYKIVD